MPKEKELYLSGYQKIIDLISLASEELSKEHKKLKEQIPVGNTLDLVDFLNDRDKRQVFDRYLELPDYVEVVHRLYWRCKNVLNKLRYEQILIDGFMDDLMWQDLGKIDALVEISECIEVTKKHATDKEQKEQNVIIYLESTFQELLEQTELSTIALDNQDKFICLYTKMVMACSKDCSEDCLDLKRLDILKFFKEGYLNAG